MDRAQLQNNFFQHFQTLGYDIDWSYLDVPFETHVIAKQECLFQQGELAERLFFMHSGLVRYVSVSDDGREFTHTFTRGPSIIGSTLSMVTGEVAPFGIQALEDCLVTSYPWQAFYQQMRHEKGFLEYYVHFLERIFILKAERERALARDSAERRYLDFCVNFSELKDHIPQQYIASYIGITPVALSRIRQRLKFAR